MQQPAAKITKQPKKPFDLKALQDQIQKNLATDFTKLINTKINDFHMDICTTFEKTDNSYYECSTVVTILMQQQQCMHNMLESLQNNLKNHFNHPSPSNGEMGVPKCLVHTFLQIMISPSPPPPRMTAPSTPHPLPPDTKDATLTTNELPQPANTQ